MPNTTLAEPNRTAIQATIRRASASARRNMSVVDAEARRDLKRIYTQAVADLSRDVRLLAAHDGNVKLDVLQRLLTQASSALVNLENQRDAILSSSLNTGATAGANAFAADSAVLSASLTNLATDAVSVVRNFIAEDGLQLSDRIWRTDTHAKRVVKEAIEQAVIQGNSASKAARDFLARGEAVPADVLNKLNAAQADKIISDIKRGVMTGKGSPMDNAMRLFRTEINRAHGEAYQATAFAHPDVIGTRFLLSPGHPKPDICDMHARVNKYGLGPGVYPKGKNPWPAHPNTKSYVESVFIDQVTQTDKQGEQTRIQWLNAQTKSIQQSVLASGKKRAALARGLLKENQIATPWNVLKKRFEQKGINTNLLDTKAVNEAAVFPGKKINGFIPADNVRDAEKWMLDNDLVGGVDYKNAHIAVVNQWNKSIYDHVSEFPQLRSGLKFTGSMQSRNKRMYDDELSTYIFNLKKTNPTSTLKDLEAYAKRRVKKIRAKGGVWAVSNNHNKFGGVTINDKWAKDITVFQRSLDANVSNGFHPLGTNSVKAVIDHELGHQLDNLMSISKQKDIIDLHKLWYTKEPSGAGLSIYARKNIREFVAEAWSEYRNSDEPRVMASLVGRFIQKKYKEKFNGG